MIPGMNLIFRAFRHKTNQSLTLSQPSKNKMARIFLSLQTNVNLRFQMYVLMNLDVLL